MMLCARFSKATVLLAVLSFILVGPHISELSGQSRVVSLSSNSNGAFAVELGVPSDLSPRISQVEELLAQPCQPPFAIQEVKFGRIVDWLNKSGLPTVMHESAIDNNLDEDQRISLAVADKSIETSLFLILQLYQCTFYIQPSGLIVILSEDAAWDNMMRVTYDVGQFTADPDDISITLQETIDPDSWEEMGGTGKASVVRSDGKRLLVVLQTYENHLAIRQQLSGLSFMVGNTMPGKTLDSLTKRGSRPVLLPGEFDPYSRRANPWGHGGGFGGGGFGGGGGGFGGRGGSGLGGGVF